MDMLDVLIVEDDISLCEALSDTLELAGYRVASAGDGVQALERLSRQAAGLVLSDVQMANMDGLTLLERLRTAHPDLPVLLMTAYGTIEKAVHAMRAGAADYLVKPFAAETLLTQVSRHMSPRIAEVSPRVVEDASMKRLFGLAAKVAQCEATVLIQGESGVGKEVLARYIHQSSPRHSGPFIAINCAAIPENMLEAELFGFEKGAFTGAVQTVPGRLELARGGTLLLDEVSEMALPLQAKLLRVLQEREMERVGGRKTIELDIRVLATSNRNLKERVGQGEFREDLYYRLSVFPILIPALRERRGDIVPLAKTLLKKHWTGGKAVPELSRGAESLLLEYAWPGNVRELDNVMQRALILCAKGCIDAEDLIFETSPVPMDGIEYAPESDEPASDRLGKGLRTAEERIILETLRQENGSRKSTADRLGISERTLRYKLARMRDAGHALPI